MSASRKILAAAFKRLSQRFDIVADGLSRMRLMEQAGDLVVDAVDRGLLADFPDITALARWNTGSGEHPFGCPSNTVRCPVNVWISVVGNDRIRVANTPRPDGSLPVTGDTRGGVLPALYRAAFPGKTLDELEQHDDALACEALASLLEDERQREAEPDDTPEQPANDWIPPAEQARMLGLDSQRDQTRRLQITGTVREKAASMGFPLDIDNRKNKGRWVRRAQWEPVSDLFRAILGKVPDANAASKVFTDAGKVETGEALFYCEANTYAWRSCEDKPVCPKCGKPAKQITPRKP